MAITDSRDATGDASRKRRTTLIATIPGLLAAAAFAILWFGEAAGGCGVVRFYEYLLGGFFLALWAGGTGIGLLMFLSGGSRSRLLALPGMGLVLLSALSMLVLVAITVFESRAAAERGQKTAGVAEEAAGKTDDQQNTKENLQDVGGNGHER
jgi:ABC-type multidrug transport system permease subunit